MFNEVRKRLPAMLITQVPLINKKDFNGACVTGQGFYLNLCEGISQLAFYEQTSCGTGLLTPWMISMKNARHYDYVADAGLWKNAYFLKSGKFISFAWHKDFTYRPRYEKG